MKKLAGITGIVLAVVFMVLGFCSTTPDKYIRSYGSNKMYEYVGGDAYNYIIEAALRGGEIAGAKTTKAVYFGVAGILLVISLSSLSGGEKTGELRSGIEDVRKEIQDAKQALSQHPAASPDPRKEQLPSLKETIEPQEKELAQGEATEEAPGDGELEAAEGTIGEAEAETDGITIGETTDEM